MTLSLALDPVADLLAQPPYAFAYEEKQRRLLPILTERVRHYCAALPRFERYVSRMGFSQGPYSSYLDLPYLPVSAFKEFELRCVPQEQVVRVLQSSGTTQSVPSRIFLDKPTAFRQSKALASILMDVVGSQKKPYLVLDCDSINQPGSALTARGASVRGFLPFASSTTYALRQTQAGMELDIEALERFFAETRDRPVLVSGFTYIIWAEVVQKLRAHGVRFDHPEMSVLHSGGWKRLQQASVDKAVFVEGVAEVFGCPPGTVRDFYGMVEQVGIIFVDCEGGHKHSPSFGEVILRSLDGFGHARVGEPGIIQVSSVLPSSYPGHAIVTEDLGMALGYDDCPCGRPGLYFRFLARVAKAEIRGCGDTFAASRELRAAADVQPPSSKSAPGPAKIALFGSGPRDVGLADLRPRLLRDFEPWTETPTGALVALLDAAGKRFVSEEFAGIEGIAFLSSWLRRTNTTKTLSLDLGAYAGALDSPVAVGAFRMRAVPRGLACHWIAGNIPTLAVFSWALATLARNANLIRVPAASWDVVHSLFRAIESVSVEYAGKHYSGSELLGHTALLHFDSDGTSLQHLMSLAADVRVIWGGAEAVQAISSYPRMDHCEDVVFGPKFSIAVMDRRAAQDEAARDTALRGIVRDAVMFDQAACSSPQLLYVEAEESSLSGIAEAIEREFRNALRRIRIRISDAEAARVINARAHYALADNKTLRVPTDLSFTVLVERGARLREAVQARTLFVIGLEDVMEVLPLLSPKIQTIGAVFGDAGKYQRFSQSAAIRGVARIVKPGAMNLYEVPWDGMMPISRLVRWCRA